MRFSQGPALGGEWSGAAPAGRGDRPPRAPGLGGHVAPARRTAGLPIANGLFLVPDLVAGHPMPPRT